MIGFFKGLLTRLTHATRKDPYVDVYIELINKFRRVTPLSYEDLTEIGSLLERLAEDSEYARTKFKSLEEIFKFLKEEERKKLRRSGGERKEQKNGIVRKDNDVSYYVNGEVIYGDVGSGDEEEYFDKQNIEVIDRFTSKNIKEGKHKEKECQGCIEARIRREITKRVYMESKAAVGSKKRLKGDETVVNRINERLGCPILLGRAIADDTFSLDDLDETEREAFIEWKKKVEEQSKQRVVISECPSQSQSIQTNKDALNSLPTQNDTSKNFSLHLPTQESKKQPVFDKKVFSNSFVAPTQKCESDNVVVKSSGISLPMPFSADKKDESKESNVLMSQKNNLELEEKSDEVKNSVITHSSALQSVETLSNKDDEKPALGIKSIDNETSTQNASATCTSNTKPFPFSPMQSLGTTSRNNPSAAATTFKNPFVLQQADGNEQNNSLSFAKSSFVSNKSFLANGTTDKPSIPDGPSHSSFFVSPPTAIHETPKLPTDKAAEQSLINPFAAPSTTSFGRPEQTQVPFFQDQKPAYPSVDIPKNPFINFDPSSTEPLVPQQQQPSERFSSVNIFQKEDDNNTGSIFSNAEPSNSGFRRARRRR